MTRPVSDSDDAKAVDDFSQTLRDSEIQLIIPEGITTFNEF